MDERNQWIISLESYLPYLRDICNRRIEITEIKALISKNEYWIENVQSGNLDAIFDTRKVFWRSAIKAWFIMGIAVTGINLLLSSIGLGSFIVIINLLGFVIYYLAYLHGKNKVNEMGEQYKKEAHDTIELSKPLLETKLNEFYRVMQTKEYQYVYTVVPPDYFYPEAVERFLFYLRNGHADNLKDALRLYDQEVHNQKMEQEAVLQTAAAQASVSAAQSAAESSELARKAAANAEFWSLYNAYLTEKMSRR